MTQTLRYLTCKCSNRSYFLKALSSIFLEVICQHHNHAHVKYYVILVKHHKKSQKFLQKKARRFKNTNAHSQYGQLLFYARATQSDYNKKRLIIFSLMSSLDYSIDSFESLQFINSIYNTLAEDLSTWVYIISIVRITKAIKS